MIRTILVFGAIAGLIVAAPMFGTFLFHIVPPKLGHSLLFGYLVMLLALSLIFVGVKRFRDQSLGGVIRFLPALLVGLGVSAVAGFFYVAAWELIQAATHNDFANSYAAAMVESAHAKGASPAELQRVTAQAQAFKTQYADPLYRLPMTFAEIFPVGVLISLISAGLLRNRRFLPARAPV